MSWPRGDPSILVRTILAQPAYRVPRATSAPPQVSLLQLAWTWFANHVLAPLFAPIARAATAAQGVGAALGIGFVVLASLGFAFVTYRLIVAFVRERPKASGGFADSTTAPDSANLRAAARAAAQRGEYARAIGALFSAALALLDEGALIAFDAARTPSEYRRFVRASRIAAAPPFDELADRFVLAAYAPHTPAREDFEAAERAYAAFEPAVVA